MGSRTVLLLELQNTPFFARGVSYLDIVRATESDGASAYAGTVREGGHSTYRIIARDVSDFDQQWQPLGEMGCSYESTTTQRGHLYAVDVPPAADLSAAYAILEAGEAEGIWIFQEGHVPTSRIPTTDG
jgi:hypothetical protein